MDVHSTRWNNPRSVLLSAADHLSWASPAESQIGLPPAKQESTVREEGQNRETGAITIAQAPNLSLWVAILAGALIWVGHPSERLGVVLEVILKAALFFWAGDEVLRGINPWRRCLGIIVLCYGLWMLPR
jgi:hypothetical protein